MKLTLQVIALFFSIMLCSFEQFSMSSSSRLRPQRRQRENSVPSVPSVLVGFMERENLNNIENIRVWSNVPLGSEELDLLDRISCAENNQVILLTTQKAFG